MNDVPLIEQIKGMTDEELAALNRKLARKVLLVYVVIPVVAAVVAAIIDKKLGD